ncbi:GSCFA domain-containing protein [Pseudoruegeria sp. SHC-113]|uniref:GSCFA domain-containing protein n=1 Tax=Pseudoruegeria sp. SHC-113 TaxID=2855439 RepID=UPI0021BB809F|nr:GSCFA domain-containing protein [Pseudoruegeria sp. SHC-113]MCT8159967.1 GSCFA domain-containing protein [Pseudoruegeria sp. SHC-113]
MADHETPYTHLPPEKFWRSGVAQKHITQLENVYTKKFDIAAEDRISTQGSCFAQHVARYMKEAGYNIIDMEPPLPGMTDETAKKFGYSVYSARYGNIYSVRQWLQLFDDAREQAVREEDVFERDGRYYDGLRPAVEPYGLGSKEEVIEHRKKHLENVRRLFRFTDVYVFTLGLTECWVNRESGTVYPICPGVIAGTFDPEKYEFRNFRYEEVYRDFVMLRRKIKRMNENARFLITTSPVPLTATATDKHILVASSHTKSVLRAVAGGLYDEFDDVDYFPGYEMATTHTARGFYYNPNQRTISPDGVALVMKAFLDQHRPITAKPSDDERAAQIAARRAARGLPPLEGRAGAATAGKAAGRSGGAGEEELVCEEIMLEAFAK